MSDTMVVGEPAFGGGGQGGGGAAAGESGGDRARLIAFIETLDKDLQAMIADQRFLPEDLRTTATQAYEAGGEPQMLEMIRMLAEEWDDHIGSLRHHGLTGVQLDFKLRVHGQARDRYLTPPPPDRRLFVVETDGSLADISADAWANAAAKDYLDCSDIVLESLSSALGGAGAAVIEIKKMIEWLKGAGTRWMRRLIFS